jgi:glucose dehydrogenase
MSSGVYNNQRYSKLDKISDNKIQNLNLAWLFSTGVLGGHEGNVLVIDETMYVHKPFPNIVFALNLNNDGAIKWKYQPTQSHDETVTVIYCETVKRGLSYGDRKIFLNQADTTLVALDMNTGQLIWSDKRYDSKRGATSNGVAFVIKDKVLVCISGSEFCIRAYVQANGLDRESYGEHIARGQTLTC